MSTNHVLSTLPAEKSTPQTSASIQSVLKDFGIVKDLDDTPCFEYIVIGGGTAGLALASRLAKDLGPGQYVCVIEAGLYHKNADIDIPGSLFVSKPSLRFTPSTAGEDYDWNYQSVPQPYLDDRQIPCSGGRLLGGSSGINFLVRMRASSPEYDAWDEFGPGWTWNNLLPYFKAAEHYEAYARGTDQIFPGITKEEDEEARRREPEFRGHGGGLHSTHNTIYTDLLKPTIETTLKFGIQTNRSPSCGNSTGMFNIDTAVDRKQGIRSYAANAYLRSPESVLPQENIIVLHGICATKILFDSNNTNQNARAIGVTCSAGVDWKALDKSGFSFELNAREEIIVSAGVYNTPRLLELSGVGNSKILSEFNIPTVVDLPGVGENLQEHPCLIFDFILKEGVFTLDRLRNDSIYMEAQWKEYCEKKTGVYATTVSVYGFIKLRNFLTTEEVTEMQTDLENEISRTTNLFYKRQLEIQREYLAHDGVGDMELVMVPKVFATDPPKKNTSYISLMVVLPHPVARGYVHVASANPLDAPTINPNYLNNSFDTKMFTKAALFARKLSETAPLKDIIDSPSTPGPEVQTEAEFERYVRENLDSIQHPLGTAAMAPKSLGGVVDGELRVYGTQNVRVADMSIAPLHIGAHLVDTAYAIGEKASDLIKAARERDH